MRYFLCFFFGTGDGEQCREGNGAGGALHTETEMLGASSEQLGPETGLRVASMNKALK